MADNKCVECGKLVLCVDCTEQQEQKKREAKYLDQARRILESLPREDTKFRAVPIAKFNVEELQKIIQLCISERLRDCK